MTVQSSYFLDCLIDISSSLTVSEAVDLKDGYLVGVITPADFDGTTITFQQSADNLTWYPVHDSAGNVVTLTTAASRYTAANPDLFLGIRYLKAVAGTNQTTTDTLLKLAVRRP